MKTLTKRIEQLISEWPETPKEINNGLCADFAHILWEEDRSLNITNDEEKGADDYTHTFIESEGRYYDAECPGGVEDWRELPIFSR